MINSIPGLWHHKQNRRWNRPPRLSGQTNKTRFCVQTSLSIFNNSKIHAFLLSWSETIFVRSSLTSWQSWARIMIRRAVTRRLLGLIKLYHKPKQNQSESFEKTHIVHCSPGQYIWLFIQTLNNAKNPFNLIFNYKIRSIHSFKKTPNCSCKGNNHSSGTWIIVLDYYKARLLKLRLKPNVRISQIGTKKNFR